MSTAVFAIPFDTLACVKKLEASGVPAPQAEAQVEMLSDVLQKVEASRMQELATKGDVEIAKLELRKEIEFVRKDVEKAKVEMIKWVVATGIVILGGVTAIGRYFPLVSAYYQPPAQEMRFPAPAIPHPERKSP